MARRLAGQKEALTELGMATMRVVTTSLIAERAIKTLIAQAIPEKKPSNFTKGTDGHDLNLLFSQILDPADQAAVQHQLRTLPTFWSKYAETSSVENVLSVASTNFVDWRYAMEPSGADGGVPKPLLKVAVALTLVGIDRLIRWQRYHQIVPPT